MKNLITILGPTASGKTSLAVALAYRLQSEIISADSRQFYRGMDIGTGKDLSEYCINGVHIPYHLIDIRDAGYKYNLFEYHKDFKRCYEDIRSRNMIPILCGGSGLYIESVLKGYKLVDVPENKELRASLQHKSLQELETLLRRYKTLHNTTDIDTAQRAIRAIEIAEYSRCFPVEKIESSPIDSLIIGISVDRNLRRAKISERLAKRIDEGMIDEVRKILSSGVLPEDLIYYGLEYKYVTEYVIGKIPYDTMFSSLEIAIHQFAKRQMTWFRGMERRGLKINWLDIQMPTDEKVDCIINWFYSEK